MAGTRRLVEGLLLLLIGGCGILSLVAQERSFVRADATVRNPDHLTPVDLDFTNYDKAIVDFLFGDRQAIARFVVRPSFDPESCLSLVEAYPPGVLEKWGKPLDAPPGVTKRFYLIRTLASDSIWAYLAEPDENARPQAIRVERVQREISRESAIAIQQVWAAVLWRTRYPQGGSGILDGVVYQFCVRVEGLGTLYGETHSPESGLAAEMVRLGEALEDFTKDPKRGEGEMMKHLESFRAKLAATDRGSEPPG